MRMNTLFEKALAIQYPWFIKEIRFDEGQKQLDIFIDFRRGPPLSTRTRDRGARVNSRPTTPLTRYGDT